MSGPVGFKSTISAHVAKTLKAVMVADILGVSNFNHVFFYTFICKSINFICDTGLRVIELDLGSNIFVSPSDEGKYFYNCDLTLFQNKRK